MPADSRRALGAIFGALNIMYNAVAYVGFHASTLNWQSFSQVTFAFRVTPTGTGDRL
ncbi:MAG TPA: hypothetical protein VLX28_26420 [Thermoanaerobaculia bacterium]|nr:hypothetical protein [Thermoanaerobaculia bacterium]